MNVLILNWRDPKSPLAGGAEKITFKYAQHWQSSGNKVFWISNRFSKGKSYESISKIKVFRVGSFLFGDLITLCFKYPWYLMHTIILARKVIKKYKIDLIVDEIHGLPFFTPLFFNVPSVLLVCEVADEIWKKMFPFPINFIGSFIEKIVYSLYRSSEIWAISESTKADILNINPNLKVKVIPLGIDAPKLKTRIRKTKFPSAVFLARIVKMKGAEAAIASSARIIKKLPTFKLYMIGNGPSEYLTELKNKVQVLRLQDTIVFMGRVSEEQKYEVLQKSHFLIHPSHKEGFGLTILEAGICGTPAIARSGSSLDELIIDKSDGLLFTANTRIAQLFIKHYNSANYRRMQSLIKVKSRNYLWKKILKTSNLI